MAGITLYYAPGACSLAAHILLKESGLQYSSIRVDISKGFPSNLKQINPKMRVPILVLDKAVITESPAIFLAISQLSPEKTFMGSTKSECVRVLEWMNWLSGTLHGQGFGGLLRLVRYTDDSTMFDAIKTKSRASVVECFLTIEQKLSGLHAVGDRFTAVDPYLYVFYRWGDKHQMQVEQYKKYTALVANLVKRPSVRAAVEEEGITSVPRL